jgi:hypothetical protein
VINGRGQVYVGGNVGGVGGGGGGSVASGGKKQRWGPFGACAPLQLLDNDADASAPPDVCVLAADATLFRNGRKSRERVFFADDAGAMTPSSSTTTTTTAAEKDAPVDLCMFGAARYVLTRRGVLLRNGNALESYGGDATRVYACTTTATTSAVLADEATTAAIDAATVARARRNWMGAAATRAVAAVAHSTSESI